MKQLACYELSKCLPFRNIAEYRSQVAAILKTKMAAKNWTYQLASIKIPVQDDLNYLCAKIHNFIQKCTLHLIYWLKSPHYMDMSMMYTIADRIADHVENSVNT